MSGLVAATVAAAARTYGDHPALVTPSGWMVSYRALDRLSDETAAGLARAGVAAGDVVALLLPSGCDFVVCYLAAAKLGAITAGVNPRLSSAQRAQAVDVLGARLMIATAELGVGGDEIVIERAGGTEEIARALRVPDTAPDPLPDDPSRPIAIVLTSGTTGGPKGAVFGEKQFAAYDAIEVKTHDPAPGTPMLASTEFAHIGFMTRLPWHLRTGARIHTLERWRPSEALRVVSENKMPVLGGIAAQFALMLRDPSFDSFDLTCVQALIAGGGPSPPALITEARERFGAAYSVRYSCTESGGLGTLTAFDAPDEEALHTVGRPRPGVDLRIVDDDGAERPAGEVGEVCLRSPTTMDGYWRDPEATARVLRDGWLHTGDLGFIDDIGCLRLAGRAMEMYIRGGYNVYPMAVESVLAAHPQVAHVAIAPRPDELMGEIGVAVVVPSHPAAPPSLEDLRSFAGDRLAKHELPERIRIVDELPLNAMHKLDRRALAAQEREGTR